MYARSRRTPSFRGSLRAGREACNGAGPWYVHAVRRSLLAALVLVLPVGCGKAPAASTTFRVAFLSDTHLIDQYYVGPENTPLDTESIYHSAERLQKTRDVVNRIVPAVERVFVSGDITHDLASTDMAFYDTNQTVFDTANALFSSFNAPVFIGLGNHDYDPTRIPRAMSEALFVKKLGKFMPAPYYIVDYKGWRFIHLDCFDGYTWDVTNPNYDNDNSYGSFGRRSTQLAKQTRSSRRRSLRCCSSTSRCLS